MPQGSGANKWYVHHQGGGWCESLDDCLGRSKTGLGSSNGYPDTAGLGGGYFDTDQTQNPLMYVPIAPLTENAESLTIIGTLEPLRRGLSPGTTGTRSSCGTVMGDPSVATMLLLRHAVLTNAQPPRDLD